MFPEQTIFFFLPGKHANKCIGTLLRPCDGHREEEPERKTLKGQESFLLCKPCWKGPLRKMVLLPSIMYWFTISVRAWTCLSFHTTRPINLMCRAGRRAIIDKKRTPESFHVSMTYCAADYFSILLHPQKIQLLTLYLKK